MSVTVAKLAEVRRLVEEIREWELDGNRPYAWLGEGRQKLLDQMYDQAEDLLFEMEISLLQDETRAELSAYRDGVRFVA